MERLRLLTVSARDEQVRAQGPGAQENVRGQDRGIAARRRQEHRQNNDSSSDSEDDDVDTEKAEMLDRDQTLVGQQIDTGRVGMHSLYVCLLVYSCVY
jgi:hypothetical protein